MHNASNIYSRPALIYIEDFPMAAIIIENPYLRIKSGIFKDRHEAGDVFHQSLETFIRKSSIILAMPSGGIYISLALSTIPDLHMEIL